MNGGGEYDGFAGFKMLMKKRDFNFVGGRVATAAEKEDTEEGLGTEK